MINIEQFRQSILNTKSAIEMTDVGVHYGSKEALKQVNLKIPRNRVTVLIGPSGCGKSTTLRSINGLVPVSRGSITYPGLDTSLDDIVELRRNMGYAIQSVGLIPHLTVWENVSLVPHLLGWDKARRRERSSELLQLVKLDPGEYMEKFPSQLSGGEGQRVGVARALGADPHVLLMDEPFGAVDPLNRETLQDEFIRIQRKLKKTVIFVTHDLEEAVRLADYLVIMKDGEIVQADHPEAILAEPADEFVEQFLGPDRALKRLTLFTADQLSQPLYSPEGAAPLPEGRCVWETDGAGIPVGVRAMVRGKEIRRSIEPGNQTVREYSSLKECMSRILSLGLPAVPVVDDDLTLRAELRYEHIQEVSLQ
ncbi:ABC transporter ATP-binding protein [Salinispira pacifica]|uniref:L-proline glycine betaine ABC transport system permease protein ProV n=1 Tax=Salinispira pacifica TaxID=1307761 RepID=V5WI81_9SPIO|nr:ABC transporter ATP-binding protein [Salinispira pacifica]AHC15512.1 L-proline glycine betaine ABC transport system permease protein ProV [Salinispira pacifica]